MKCPLLTITSVKLREDAKAADNECLKEECAWWDPTFGWCLWQTVAYESVCLVSELSGIRIRMPHEGQFQK